MDKMLVGAKKREFVRVMQINNRVISDRYHISYENKNIISKMKICCFYYRKNGKTKAHSLPGRQ